MAVSPSRATRSYSTEAALPAAGFGEVRLVGLMTIALVFLWKAQFVLVRYFAQDDIVNLDLARRSGLWWHYVTLLSGGQLTPGLRVLAWVLSRASLYDWPVAAGLLVALMGCASLAAFRVLRTLLGDRPVILVPLIVFLLSPIVMPDLGGWWAGMREVPLQLATLLAIDAHVRYVRSGRQRELVTAAGWLVFGLLFSAQAVFLPLLLFAITSAFLVGAPSWRGGVALAARRFAPAWRWYGIVLVCYAVTYLSALSSAGPRTVSGPMWKLALTGLAGGPWAWHPVGPGLLYAMAFPSAALIVAVALVVVVTVALSVWARPVAWRAWLILGAWLFLGDPAAVLAICVGLAFFPLAGDLVPAVAWPRRALTVRSFCLVLGTLFIAGSVWSDQAYENVTNGYPEIAAYLSNAGRAVALAEPGTNVLDLPVPAPLVSPAFGLDGYESVVIGPLTDRLRWVERLRGTIAGLKMFGPDGRLYPTLIYGVRSPRRREPGLAACWPRLGRRVTVRFARRTGVRDRTLQLNYIWAGVPARVEVRYGSLAGWIRLVPGLHNAYLPVRGRVRSVTVYGAVSHLCVGGAEAGVPVPL
ncbi:MAG TPA: hypothetical protein VMA95_14745 [Streptosporangiaceae bacterium]|nr:hypothetical protein [Streptosporangiaceae bacterium]